MRKIKYAIIGFGGVAENRIAREGFGMDRSRFAGHTRAELVGVTDTDVARREAAAGLGLRWYDSADAVTDDPDVEAVFIATNNAAHAVVAETLEDARRIQRFARDRHISLAVDHMMTENVYNRRARELVEQGVVGQVNDAIVCTWPSSCWAARSSRSAACTRRGLWTSPSRMEPSCSLPCAAVSRGLFGWPSTSLAAAWKAR